MATGNLHGGYERRRTRHSLRASLLSVALSAITVMGLSTPGDAASVAVEKDVVYASVGEERLTLDVSHSPGSESLPIVLLVHGGSWHGGDKSNWSGSVPVLVRSGFLVFSMNYRLSPPEGEALFPAPSEDVARALGWIGKNAARYGGDPDRVALIGSSAGAQISLLAALDGTVDVDAVVAWSPPVFLDDLAREGLARPLEHHLGCTVAECRQRYREASPITHVDRDDPPVFLSNATNELIPLHHSQELAAELDRAGVPHELRVLLGDEHAQQYRERILPRTIDFLDRYLKPAVAQPTGTIGY